MNVDLGSIEAGAAEAEKVLEKVMEIEPTIVGTVGIFVPEVAVAQPFILAAAPAIEKALEALAQGNGGNMIQAVADLIKHVTPGLPNAPTLHG